MWTPLESFSNDVLAGTVTDVLGPALARDNLAGSVFVVGGSHGPWRSRVR
jgi:hypothetical protein